MRSFGTQQVQPEEKGSAHVKPGWKIVLQTSEAELPTVSTDRLCSFDSSWVDKEGAGQCLWKSSLGGPGWMGRKVGLDVVGVVRGAKSDLAMTRTNLRRLEWPQT